jgi:hypothetical protein
MISMHTYEIFRAHHGLWRARRSDGLVDGLFVDKRSALRFARREVPACSILLRN